MCENQSSAKFRKEARGACGRSRRYVQSERAVLHYDTILPSYCKDVQRNSAYTESAFASNPENVFRFIKRHEFLNNSVATSIKYSLYYT